MGHQNFSLTQRGFDLDDGSWFVLCAPEAALAHQEFLPERIDEYGNFFGEVLQQGLAVTGMEYAAADKVRHVFRGELRKARERVDVIACPSSPVSAFKVTREDLLGGVDSFISLAGDNALQFTGRYNYSGSPTLSLPCGFNEAGMPLSLQLVGHHLDEALLCRIGHTYEGATDWHAQHPVF